MALTNITEELDRIASEVQKQDPMIALAIDKFPLGNPQVDGDTCIQANDDGTILLTYKR